MACYGLDDLREFANLSQSGGILEARELRWASGPNSRSRGSRPVSTTHQRLRAAPRLGATAWRHVHFVAIFVPPLFGHQAAVWSQGPNPKRQPFILVRLFGYWMKWVSSLFLSAAVKFFHCTMRSGFRLLAERETRHLNLTEINLRVINTSFSLPLRKGIAELDTHNQNQ